MGSWITAPGSGITSHGIGISSFLKDQGTGLPFLWDAKVCHAFEIKDQKLWYKNGISDDGWL